MEIINNLHLVPNIVANPYLIIDPDGLTLIDAGLPGSDKKILRYISGLGRSSSDLKQVLITHSDIDHVGGLSAVKKASGARVYASAIEAEAIAKGKPSRDIKPANSAFRMLMGILRRFVKVTPLRPDELLNEGQVLPVLGGLQVIETPGHTPGHISLFSPSTGVLFTGDSIISQDGILLRSIPANTWDEAKAERVGAQTSKTRRNRCLSGPRLGGQGCGG